MLAKLFALLPLFAAVSASAACHKGGCPVRDLHIKLPAQQTNVTAPPRGHHPIYVTLGVGTQNYTCNATTNTYSSLGGNCLLYDASCYANTVELKHLVNETWTLATNHSVKAAQKSVKLPFVGDHYFQAFPKAPFPGAATFDFRRGAKKHDSKGYVAMYKIGTYALPPAKRPPFNSGPILFEIPEPWQKGTLAQILYRVDVAGGNAPPKCLPGKKHIEVPFSSVFWFYD